MPAQSPLLPFVTLERETIARCRVFNVERVRRRSQLSGQAHDFFHIDAGDWVNVIALTPDDQVVLVRQERHGLGAFTLEFPAGLVEPGEDPGAAAVRELAEETGYTADRAEPLGWVHPNPALQDNRCFTYLARGARQTRPQELDGREEIEIVVVPRARLRDMIRTGELTHSLVISAVMLLEINDRV